VRWRTIRSAPGLAAGSEVDSRSGPARIP
jgi:hypothetical protein